MAQLEGLEVRRKQAEEALRESEAKFRLISEQSILGIAILQDGYVRYANQAVEEILEYTMDEMLLRWEPDEFAKAIHPDDRSFAMEQAQKKQRGERDVVVNYSYRIITKDGNPKWIDQYSKTVFYEGKYADLVTVIDVTERKRAEENLQESQKRFKAQYQGIPIPTYTWQKFGEDFVLVDVNNAGRALTQGGIDDYMGRTATQMYRENRPDILEDLWRCFTDKVVIKREMSYRFQTTGEEKRLAATYAFVPPDLIMVHTEDITDRSRLEEQLLWSQRMESIGRLAGGVAHDFNNLLTSIAGYAELGMNRVDPDDRLYRDLQEILRATDRASQLTRQLLAFSRREITEPKVINLNEVLLDTNKMFLRLIGEDIELVIVPAEGLGCVKVDPGQIEQVLVNLLVNARDAMANGGKLTIETASVTLDADYSARHVGVSPGEYIMLAVSDTGVGMAEEIKAHLFEPFFTTKEVGKGTGLGLATCYGIVKQSGGNIWVYSEPGVGTTFKIYLPRVEEDGEHLPKLDASKELPRGRETVLLVEDEPSVRRVTALMLREQGYTVFEAATGAEAIQVAMDHKGKEIHLLLTDVVMPQMSGRELADRLRGDRPDMKVLFFSGYTDNVIVHHGLLDSGITFLQKPFLPATLANKVRDLLGR